MHIGKRLPFTKTGLYLTMIFLGVCVPLLGQSSSENHGNILPSIGIAIVAATVMAFIGHHLRQPVLLAYLVAGVIIGPKIGFGFIKNVEDIEIISHFGLLLLLFLIGLEIDIKKLRESGKSLIIGGITQFPINTVICIVFFLLLGYHIVPGKFDLFYLAACLAMSSTAIVVKLLYSKFELDTLAGRISLGILVFQDLWAIILLGIQPNLNHPSFITILLSFVKGILLVIVALMISKYILPRLFKSIAKLPELMLVSSLAWCFIVCAGAALIDLSVETGALIAGIAISTFPYNLDVIAKVVNIRDFFITLFFVSLGMQIPNPLDNLSILSMAAIASGFLIVSRFLAVFPVLYSLKNGIRISLLTSINLGQISEFSLVIASLGVSLGHISGITLSIIVFVFVITSVLSTYMIKYNDRLQKRIGSWLKKLKLKEIDTIESNEDDDKDKEIALLGFYRTASSILNDIMHLNIEEGRNLKQKLVVVDFNPEIHTALNTMGIKVVYGDISHMDTLHHAGLHNVKIIISTIPDTILVGTNNLKIISHMKEIAPTAFIIVTAENVENALKMYDAGADYVFLPRILASQRVLEVLKMLQANDHAAITALVRNEFEMLQTRIELID